MWFLLKALGSVVLFSVVVHTVTEVSKLRKEMDDLKKGVHV